MDAISHSCDVTGFAMPAEIIAQALGARKAGAGWMARCLPMTIANRAFPSALAKMELCLFVVMPDATKPMSSTRFVRVVCGDLAAGNQFDDTPTNYVNR